MLFHLPVPMPAGAVVSTMYLVIDITTNRNLFIPQAWQIAMAGAMTVVSLLMMSRVIYPSFKHITFRKRGTITAMLLAIAVVCALICFPWIAPALIFLCERYLPRFCHFVAQWGPAAFFVYVTHYILLEWLRTLLTGRYGGSLSVLQAAWAPFVILAASLALYALLCRLAPGFMRLFALAPTRQADKGLAMNAESNTATHATST